MADFEIIEADFQQYYHLDVSTLGFRRYARLLINLPAESRFVRKYSPFRDWSWDKEMQAQILRAVDTIATLYANTHRKKGQKALESPELVQPDYVARAKKDAKRQKRDDQAATLGELKAFFEKRNNTARNI